VGDGQREFTLLLGFGVRECVEGAFFVALGGGTKMKRGV
jgi:hypothetical protein